MIHVGIKKAVEILEKASGIETFEVIVKEETASLNRQLGSMAHQEEAGWRALGGDLDGGLADPLRFGPVQCVLDSNEPTGPPWEALSRQRPS